MPRFCELFPQQSATHRVTSEVLTYLAVIHTDSGLPKVQVRYKMYNAQV